MREKDNLLKQRRNGSQDENQHSAMKPELQALTRQLEKCNQEKDGLQERLHNSVTEYEIQKSKLELDTTILRQKLDVMSSRNETESSPVIICDSEGNTLNERKTYSSAASSGIDVTQHSATSTSDHQRTSRSESATSC